MTKIRSQVRKRVSTLIGPPAPQKHRGGGFTLIELLVVIAIIALLVSILLPSLQRAKELAKRAVCAANLHHLCMAVQTYAAEYDGWQPPEQGGGFDECGYMGHTPPDPHPAGYHGTRSSAQLGPHVYDQRIGVYSDSRNGWTGYYYITWWWRAMAPYLSDPNILVCPSSELAGNVDTRDNWFGYNTYYWFAWTWSNERKGYYAGIRNEERRLTQADADELVMSDRCMLTAQGWYVANHVDPSGEWIGSARDGGREAAGANHLYVAGDVSWVDGENLVDLPLYYDNILFAQFPEE